MNVGKIGSMLTEQFTNQCHLGATFQDVLWAMVKNDFQNMVLEWPFLDFNEWITPTLLADP